ncbi:MAG TPA: hypothetical protein VG937_13880 [Polyangiaceae bacterium]|jgi:hypothetical protein|nr:hypothetical protein [Polyangiaceae bacterium]
MSAPREKHLRWTKEGTAEQLLRRMSACMRPNGSQNVHALGRGALTRGALTRVPSRGAVREANAAEASLVKPALGQCAGTVR